MVVAEAAALLFIGLFSGILATMFDVLCVGAASFISHFSLWVLLNALIAVHVESRTKAIWWAVPFNLGYIESYFITTVASYESFSKSLIVPLAVVAVISPLLTYGLWTAKREKNAYGQALSLLIVAGTLISSFVLNATLSIYAVVTSLLLAFVLLKMPVHRLKISRSTRIPSEAQSLEQDTQTAPGIAREGRPRESFWGNKTPSKESPRPRRRFRSEGQEANKESVRPARKHLLLARTKKDDNVQKPANREKRRGEQQGKYRKSQGQDHNQGQNQVQGQPQNNAVPPHAGMSTLGNARVARRSTRSTARYD